MKTLVMPAPLPRLLRPPVAYRIALAALGARALLTRWKRPRPAFSASDFDFSGLAADAPYWLAQLTERND